MSSGVSVRFFTSLHRFLTARTSFFPLFFSLGRKRAGENCVNHSLFIPCFCGIVNFTHTFPAIPHVYPHGWIEYPFNFAQRLTYFLHIRAVSHTVPRFSSVFLQISTHIFTAFSPFFHTNLWITWITLRYSAPFLHFSTDPQRRNCGKVAFSQGERIPNASLSEVGSAAQP